MTQNGLVGALLVSTLSLVAVAASAQGVPEHPEEGSTTAGDAIVPPQLVEFVAAEYPEAARAQGLEGEVVLELVVGADGHVTEARVVGGAGHGFDQAAMEAVKAFRFDPALRRGEPTSARIRFRYPFQLQVESSAAPELVEQQGPATKVGPAIEEQAPDTAGEAGPALEVTVEGEYERRGVTRREITRHELETMPGTRGDPLRGVENMPGVAVLELGDADIIVRGMEPSSTQVFVDGLPVLRPYHGLGISAIVPAEVLSRLEFYPGNTSVKYGRGLGGVIEMQTRHADTSGEYHGLVQADLIDVRALAEGPVPGVRDWYFVGSVRRSVVEWTLEPAFGWGVKPTYYDYQVFAETSPNQRSFLRLGVVGSHDQTEEYAFQFERNEESYSFSYLTTNYQVRPTERLTWSHTLALGMYRERELHTRRHSGYEIEVPAHPFVERTELDWEATPWAAVQVGTDVIYAPFRVTREPVGDGAASRSDESVEAHEVHFRPAAYTELTLAPVERLEVVAGLRADYTRGTAEWDVTPRGAVRLDVIRQPWRTTLKGGVGLVAQPPDPMTLLEGSENSALTSARAVQATAGFEQEMFDALSLSVEGYSYWLERLIVASSERENVALGNSGTGRTIGLETLLRYDGDDHFYGWVSYTLSRSTRRAASDEPELLIDEDQTHLVSALGSYRFGRGWEAGVKWKFFSGLPYTPYEGSIYSALAQRQVPIQGETNSARLPDHHHLDLRVQKSWALKHWKATAYVDVINAYAKRRVVDIWYNSTYTDWEYEHDVMATIPSAGFRAEF